MRDGEGEVCVGREGIGRGNVDGRTRSGTEGIREACVYKPPSYFVWLEFCPPLALHGLSVRRFCSAKFRALVCSSTPHHFIFGALGNCMHQGHLWLEKAVVPLHHHHLCSWHLACLCMHPFHWRAAKVPVSWHLASLCMHPFLWPWWAEKVPMSNEGGDGFRPPNICPCGRGLNPLASWVEGLSATEFAQERA